MVPTDGAGTGGARALRPRRAGALLHQARDCGSDATTTTAPRALGDCAHTAAGPAASMTASTQLDSTLLGPSPYSCWAMTAPRGGRYIVTYSNGWSTVLRAPRTTRRCTAMAGKGNSLFGTVLLLLLAAGQHLGEAVRAW